MKEIKGEKMITKTKKNYTIYIPETDNERKQLVECVNELDEYEYCDGIFIKKRGMKNES